MKDNRKMCCFFGHRKIDETEKLQDILYATIEKLIVDEGVNVFLFGSKSKFDELCYRIVTEIKKKYNNIIRVYVRAEFMYIREEYENYLLTKYEETYYPEKIIGSGKAVYIERNYEMIDKCDYCICYYDENYTPAKKRKSRKYISEYQPKSGTKLAYEYANKKEVMVINVFT